MFDTLRSAIPLGMRRQTRVNYFTLAFAAFLCNENPAIVAGFKKG